MSSPVKRPSASGRYVVRLYDGFDHDWIDVSESLPWEEAVLLWKANTLDGTKNTRFEDIDYYDVFPEHTRMLYSGK